MTCKKCKKEYVLPYHRIPGELKKIGSDDWCFDCAEKVYTFELGLKYLESVGFAPDREIPFLENEFYVKYLWNTNKTDAKLCALLKEEYLEDYNFCKEIGIPFERENKLKEFCLSDMYCWTEWLNLENI